MSGEHCCLPQASAPLSAPLATAKGEAGVGDLELSLLTSPHFPNLGPKQLVSCHLIAARP